MPGCCTDDRGTTVTEPQAPGGIAGLAAARLWAAAHYPYLASGIFGARVVPAPGIGTVAVDPGWRLWADPELAARWTAAELGSVLVHHVCHLLREHAPRAGLAGVRAQESGTWIRSADAEINDDLVPAGLQLPGDPVLPRHLGCTPGLLAEQYFAATRRPGTDQAGALADGGQGPCQQDGTDALDCGSGADGLGRPWQADHPAVLPPWQARLLQRLVAQQCLTASKQAGNVPAGLLRWAAAVLEPKVDWRRALAAELRKAVADTAGAVDYTYRRPSRRATAVGNVVLPGAAPARARGGSRLRYLRQHVR